MVMESSGFLVRRLAMRRPVGGMCRLTRANSLEKVVERHYRLPRCLPGKIPNDKTCKSGKLGDKPGIRYTRNLLLGGMQIFIAAVSVARMVSFLCSIFESVLLSINHAQVEALARQ